MRHRNLLLAISALAMVAACDTDNDNDRIDAAATAHTTLETFDSPDSVLPVPLVGPSTPTCINGWIVPAAGSPTFIAGLDLLAVSLGTTARLVVVDDVRYFTGPDIPGIIEPRHEQIERWYVKARLHNDPSIRGRFLVTKRGQSGGFEAVAPFATHGWSSPHWSGFEGDGQPTTYPDLPGTWTGVRYDFVTGTGGSGNRGLPPETEGCLTDT